MTDSELLDLFFREGQRRVMAGEPVDAIKSWMQRESDRLTAIASDGGDGLMDIPESIDYYVSVLADREVFWSQAKEDQKRLLFPWPSWNKMIDPLPGGMLMTLAGADGAGKTLYAECITENYANMGFKVAYFHFELSHAVMLDRRTARWSNMTISELKGPMDHGQKERVRSALRMLSEIDGNIYYQHCPGASMENVVRTIKKLVAEHGVQAVVIDYLEKAQASATQLKAFGQNQFQREADNVEQLKSTAERLGVPIIMVSQLNKEGKRTASNELDRTFIRGAGEKSEKANVVVVFKRRSDEAGEMSDIVDVKVDKNTLGPMGSIAQRLVPQYFRVEDVTITRMDLPRF